MTDLIYILGVASGVIIALAIETVVLVAALAAICICKVEAKEYLQQYHEQPSEKTDIR